MDHIHPDDIDEVKRKYLECLATGGPVWIEYRRQSKSGDWVWIRSEGKIVERDSDGKPLRMTGIHMDISDRKHAEARIAESEARFRATFEQAAVGIGHVGPDGHWLKVNQRLCDMLGYTREELLSKSFQEITHPDDLEADAHLVEQMLRKEVENSAIEKRYFHKDGSTIYTNLTASLVWKEDDTPDYFIMVIEDVSARKEVENSLFDSERSLRRAQATAHIGSWRYDMDAKMTWSDETYRVFDVSLSDFVPTMESFLKLVHPDDRPSVQGWIENVMHKGKGGELVFRAIRPDGVIEYISGQLELINNEAGEPDYLTGTFQDISDRLLLEEQFHQAQKMEALGTLVGGIAHDFNNILAGMIGNVYLVKARVKELPDAVEKLEVVEKLSFRAAELIRQLLTFARKDRVVMKTLPLVPFVKETMKFLRSTMPENIAMNLEVKDDPGMVVGDITQLHQVMMNIINNARDAVEDVKHPEIHITLDVTHPDSDSKPLFKDAEQRSYAHLTIKDNGSGIAKHVLEHVFEPFFTTKEVGKGTGLGLAMVFGAIQSHHGFIEANSKAGKGTTIHIYLPVEEGEADMTHVIESEETLTGHGETILLVDDDKGILETGREVLEAIGYHVLVAADGEEAVKMFTAHQSDIALIIMDLVMPKMSGTSAAEKIREMDPDMKIIFCTGYDKDNALPKGKALEDVVVISKPYNIEELSQAIHQALKR